MWDQSPSLQGRFLTLRPLGKSPRMNISYSFTFSPVSLALWTHKAQWHRLDLCFWTQAAWGPVAALLLLCSLQSEGQGSLACCSPRGCKELDATERLNNTEWALKCISSPTTGKIFVESSAKWKHKAPYGSLGMKIQQSIKISTGRVPCDCRGYMSLKLALFSSWIIRMVPSLVSLLHPHGSMPLGILIYFIFCLIVLFFFNCIIQHMGP